MSTTPLVNRSYNTALLLVRLFGVVCIAWGVIGLTFATAAVILAAADAPDWLVENTLPYAVTSMLTSPLYILVGGILLGISPRVAAFIVKLSKPES